MIKNKVSHLSLRDMCDEDKYDTEGKKGIWALWVVTVA